MNATPDDASPEEIRRTADSTREEVDRTMDELEARLSVRRKVDQARERLGTAAETARQKLSTAVDAVCPDITTMIRMDHTHVLAAFRRFRSYMPIGRKRALVAHVCLALEVHAQLEEEIFYPALREVAPNDDVLDKARPEHDEMRRLISELRALEPDNLIYDETFRTLIRTVLHHVADEETVLLPLAEDTLGDQLGALGWRMTKRRMELLRPHVAELTTTTARTFPLGTAAAAAGALTVAYLLLRSGTRTPMS
jgi:hemerythrin superfamily protein